MAVNILVFIFTLSIMYVYKILPPLLLFFFFFFSFCEWVERDKRKFLAYLGLYYLSTCFFSFRSIIGPSL